MIDNAYAESFDHADRRIGTQEERLSAGEDRAQIARFGRKPWRRRVLHRPGRFTDRDRIRIAVCKTTATRTQGWLGSECWNVRSTCPDQPATAVPFPTPGCCSTRSVRETSAHCPGRLTSAVIRFLSPPPAPRLQDQFASRAIPRTCPSDASLKYTFISSVSVQCVN